MKKQLEKLFAHQRLDREEAGEALMRITAGEINDAQLAAFLTVFRMRPISAEELQGFRDALLERCVKVNWNDIESIDIVGTGGDGKNTFNISTLSCFVVAGAGYKVTKHGNYGSSSVSGSSNTLERLGYTFTNDSETLRKQLDEAGICFFHAPKFHPAMKHVGPVRKQLGFRTFFNLLGPLCHPLQPTHQLYGTSTLVISRLYQHIMQASTRKFTIVHALDGYDEISLTGNADIRGNAGKRVTTPTDFGLQSLFPGQLAGGETQDEAVRIFKSVLSGNGTSAQNDVVCANAGLAIHTIKPNQTLLDCVAEARESLMSGKAEIVLKKLV